MTGRRPLDCSRSPQGDYSVELDFQGPGAGWPCATHGQAGRLEVYSATNGQQQRGSSPARRPRGDRQSLRPQGPYPVASSSKARWCDDNEGDYETVHTSDEVIEILRERGLPHARATHYEPEGTVEPYPEVMEPDDPMQREGAAIGRHNGGRSSLPDRLKVRS